MSEELPECRECGACCSHRWSWPVLRRDRSDAGGIPPEMVREDIPLMRSVGNRCVALEGVVGAGVACGVYNVRPVGCRKFERGGALCREAVAEMRRRQNYVCTSVE